MHKPNRANFRGGGGSGNKENSEKEANNFIEIPSI